MVLWTENKLFGTAGFYRKALSIAIPIMLQQLIQSMVSLIDNFMVSGLGDVSMSGVNVAGQVLFVFTVFLNTICMSGGIFSVHNDRRAVHRDMDRADRMKEQGTFISVFGLYIVLH